MLIALCLSSILQVHSSAEANFFSYRSALPALTAKAQGRPEYGLHITSSQGEFVFTNLSYTLANPKGSANLYRVTGPGGLGPYSLGADITSKVGTKKKRNGVINPGAFHLHNVLEDGAASAGGLDKSWIVKEVDGQNFGWSPSALKAYLTNHPSVEVLAHQLSWTGAQINLHTFKIRLHKQDPPANPMDMLIPEQAKVLEPHLTDPRLWKELVTLRSALPRFTPLPIDLGGKRLWAVRGVRNPKLSQGEQPGFIILELWSEDPVSGPTRHYPVALCVEPETDPGNGQILFAEGRWYQIQEEAVDAESGRLLKLTLKPWTADVMGLLVGVNPSQALGPGATLKDREALEEQANDALIDWKTLTLPGEMASQDLRSAGNLVVHLEKGLLKLDLDVKGIRSRLDIAARAEAERKAQAELAAKDGKPAPTAGPVATESERLADLLEQRKAILMAILGSAKQSLANLRR